MDDAHQHPLHRSARRARDDARALCRSAVDARGRAHRRPDGHRLVPDASEPTPDLRWLSPIPPADDPTGAFQVEIDRATPPLTTLRVRGELDLATGPRLDAALRAAGLPALTAPLWIDLAAVTFISAGELRKLLAAVGDAQRHGLPVHIVNESPAVLRLLAVLGIHHVPGT